MVAEATTDLLPTPVALLSAAADVHVWCLLFWGSVVGRVLGRWQNWGGHPVAWQFGVCFLFWALLIWRTTRCVHACGDILGCGVGIARARFQVAAQGSSHSSVRGVTGWSVHASALAHTHANLFDSPRQQLNDCEVHAIVAQTTNPVGSRARHSQLRCHISCNFLFYIDIG